MTELAVGRGRPRRVVELMALYVAGLILLEKGQTAVRMATILPRRTHDALNRPVRVVPALPLYFRVDVTAIKAGFLNWKPGAAVDITWNASQWAWLR